MKWAVYPVNDLEPHDLYESTCKCNPEVKVRDDGDLLIVHNSFDYRELVESLIKKDVNDKSV